MDKSNVWMRASLAIVAAALPLLEAGCLCPPCPVGAGATTASTNTGGAATSAAAATPTADRLVIWDGDKVGAGQSWADCGKKDLKCKSTLAKAAGQGFNGSAGMKWHAEGPDWMGGGWNWFGWWPMDSGTNIRGYGSLTFEVKVDAKTPDLAPDGDALAIALRCGNSKIKACNTASVPLHRYVADFADGQWHKAVIPMADLISGEGAQFDPSTAWEFDLNEWSGPPRDFTVYVDDIAMEK
ncbi:MAG TPA: hypothetical protein VGL81_03550 [Polyangiaceae bacterium]